MTVFLITNLFSQQYFKKFDTVYAYDPLKKCKSGDIVLIKELPEKVTTLITHSVEEIVHKKGDIICPITNKPVVFTKYRYQVDEANKLFGKRSSTFDYEKAPARGRLEGTYDLTDKDSYIKYHEDGEEDPYACYK